MLFTIIISTYNMGHFLARSLISLLNQTYQNFEVLIIDEKSNYDTLSIVKPFIEKHSNLKYFKKPDQTLESIVNYAINANLINGEYVTLLNADDWFLNQAFELVANTLLKHPEIDVLIADSYNWFENKRQKHRTNHSLFGSGFISKQQSVSPWICQIGKFYKTNIFKRLPLLKFRNGFNDVILQAYLLSQATTFYYLSNPIACHFYYNRQSLTTWKKDSYTQNWIELFDSYERADLLDKDNREFAAVFIMTLWRFRKELKRYLRNDSLPIVPLNTDGVKFNWLPLYLRVLPLKTFFKLSSPKLWTQRGSLDEIKQPMFFTIIIPVYNGEKIIDKSLSSLVKQTYQNFEVLIIDDGSTDNTYDLVLPYLEANSNWKYFKKPNGNWGSVMNYVIENELINGQYVTILDADDWFLSTALFEVAKVFDQNPQIDILISKIKLWSETKKQTLQTVISPKSKYITSAQARTPISTPHGKFYTTKLFKQLNPLREGVAYQDIVLYNNLVTKSQSIYFLNKTLTTWWISRPNNSTQALWDKKRVDIWLDTLNKVYQENPQHEVASYVLMYLWELSRNVKSYSGPKIQIDPKLINFKWLPWFIRKSLPVKTFFKYKTRQFWTSGT